MTSTYITLITSYPPITNAATNDSRPHILGTHGTFRLFNNESWGDEGHQGTREFTEQSNIPSGSRRWDRSSGWWTATRFPSSRHRWPRRRSEPWSSDVRSSRERNVSCDTWTPGNPAPHRRTPLWTCRWRTPNHTTLNICFSRFLFKDKGCPTSYRSTDRVHISLSSLLIQ